MRIYLAGPIDLAPDRGTAWRSLAAARLRAIGHEVFSPTETLLEIGPAREARAKLKAAGHYEAFSAAMREVRRADLQEVSKADLIICHIGPPACGTYFEIAYAKTLGKPIFVHATSLQSINDWLYAELPYRCFFDDWDRLIESIPALRSAA